MTDQPTGGGTPDGEVPRVDPHIAMACEALNRADQAGYCVIEMPVCLNCGMKYSWMHCFEETVVCPGCSHRQPSCVPRIRRAGEAGIDEVMLAVNAILRGLPKVDDATMKWLEQLEPPLKAAMISYASRMVREALESVQFHAEQIAQQSMPGARVGDPMTGPYMFQQRVPGSGGAEIQESPLRSIPQPEGGRVPLIFKRRRRA